MRKACFLNLIAAIIQYARGNIWPVIAAFITVSSWVYIQHCSTMRIREGGMLVCENVNAR